MKRSEIFPAGYPSKADTDDPLNVDMKCARNRVSTVCCLSTTGAAQPQNEADRSTSFSVQGNVVALFDESVRSEFDAVSPTGFEYVESVASSLRDMHSGQGATIMLGNSISPNDLTNLATACSAVLVDQCSDDRVLTLSWFTITTDAKETLTDELWQASAVASGQGGLRAPELVLREIGNGSGMVIPGLREVECASSDEVAAVLYHVQSMLPHLAHRRVDGANPFHSVIRLAVGPRAALGAETGRRAKKDFVAMGALADKAAVWRLTLVQLGSLCHLEERPHLPQLSRRVSSATATASVPPAVPNPWAQHLHTVLLSLQRRLPSTPFHRSRAVLLLKDLLLHRQAGAVVLHLDAAAEGAQLADSAEWLRLFSLLNTALATTVPPPSSSPAPRRRVESPAVPPTASPGPMPGPLADTEGQAKQDAELQGERLEAGAQQGETAHAGEDARDRTQVNEAVRRRSSSTGTADRRISRAGSISMVGPSDGPQSQSGRARSASVSTRRRVGSIASSVDGVSGGEISPASRRRSSTRRSFSENSVAGRRLSTLGGGGSAVDGPEIPSRRRSRSASVAGRPRLGSSAPQTGGSPGAERGERGAIVEGSPKAAGGPRLFRSYVRCSLGGDDAELASMAAAAIAGASASAAVASGENPGGSIGKAGEAGAKKRPARTGGLTQKEISLAMRELSKRNKQFTRQTAAAQAEEKEVPLHLRALTSRLAETEVRLGAVEAERDALRALFSRPQQVSDAEGGAPRTDEPKMDEVAFLRAQLLDALIRIEQLTRANRELQIRLGPQATTDSTDGAGALAKPGDNGGSLSHAAVLEQESGPPEVASHELPSQPRQGGCSPAAVTPLLPESTVSILFLSMDAGSESEEDASCAWKEEEQGNEEAVVPSSNTGQDGQVEVISAVVVDEVATAMTVTEAAPDPLATVEAAPLTEEAGVVSADRRDGGTQQEQHGDLLEGPPTGPAGADVEAMNQGEEEGKEVGAASEAAVSQGAHLQDSHDQAADEPTDSIDLGSDHSGSDTPSSLRAHAASPAGSVGSSACDGTQETVKAVNAEEGVATETEEEEEQATPNEATKSADREETGGETGQEAATDTVRLPVVSRAGDETEEGGVEEIGRAVETAAAVAEEAAVEDVRAAALQARGVAEEDSGIAELVRVVETAESPPLRPGSAAPSLSPCSSRARLTASSPVGSVDSLGSVRLAETFTFDPADL